MPSPSRAGWAGWAVLGGRAFCPPPLCCLGLGSVSLRGRDRSIRTAAAAFKPPLSISLALGYLRLVLRVLPISTAASHSTAICDSPLAPSLVAWVRIALGSIRTTPAFRGPCGVLLPPSVWLRCR
ncbi:uncharacterized protein BJ171DRAFT_475887 [Polychytrium aggregatum]|uniref:uncharacterized protein n=1 Tax=Polychytrium aggregatum TaxID=110093 RepID=UPI0022FEE916|nr:uncharacterized protein BJ171DRAFT_475887 [Polychytrium aggregatum]KAI9203548.1 hypothetical protein BJ171DRAFT_475887 [Polychytrium aggregatum]